jgi:predicted ATP-grasp superfamily ATP-dependent carboligase
MNVLNPQDLYRVEPDVPELSGAVLLYEFSGFMDAGSAGNGVTSHLLEECDSRVIARFDVDQLVDYRSRRPAMTFASNRWESFTEPELAIHLLRDDAGSPFLLLSGVEPDLQWERFVAAVRGLVEQWGVRLTVGYRGIPMGAPHTRPLGVTAHANRLSLLSDYESVFNRMQIPGNIGGLLELRLGEAGLDAMGFAVHVPHYLSQATYPSSSVTLLESIEKATGLSIADEQLREAARDVDAEIDSQVRNSDEVAGVVEALERQYDMFTDEIDRRSLLADNADELPTGDELGAELERFLAEQRGRGSHDG